MKFSIRNVLWWENRSISPCSAYFPAAECFTEEGTALGFASTTQDLKQSNTSKSHTWKHHLHAHLHRPFSNSHAQQLSTRAQFLTNSLGARNWASYCTRFGKRDMLWAKTSHASFPPASPWNHGTDLDVPEPTHVEAQACCRLHPDCCCPVQHA